jgi:hypothetical protein
MNPFTLFIAIMAVTAVICILWLWLRAQQPAPGEAPEDGGAYWDAGVQHVCWHCGVRLNGPANGLTIPDRECWECHCARHVPDNDNPAVPNYVVKRSPVA